MIAFLSLDDSIGDFCVHPEPEREPESSWVDLGERLLLMENEGTTRGGRRACGKA